ncbi:MAG: ABC-F family ATP-binding cassette domain-containing protein [Lachnospiraceae bacterium]|nr:ABC-F family ATP-binding cassette domain-containing protein [Lachnospiraceae bacterium]
MLQIKNLNILHKKDLNPLLKDFSLTINPGDKAVIIGEEGNGKSTLLAWIYDPELVESYAEVSGQRLLSGERLAYLPQEMPEKEKAMSVQDFFSADPAFWEIPPRDLARHLEAFGLEKEFPYREQTMGSLSGGERVKASLLKLVLSEPTVLLLDEPSNDIDLDFLAWLEDFIRRFPGAVLFISHDETLIESCANMVVHLEQLRKKQEPRHSVVRLPYAQYIHNRRRDFENQERQAESDLREKKARDERFRKINQKVENALRNVSRQDPSTGRLLKKKMHAVKSLEARFAREDEKMTALPEQEEAIFFKLEGKEREIPGGKTVLEYSLPRLTAPGGRLLAQDVFLRIRGPEHIGIHGKNGAGKTTLLKKLAEELLPREDLRALYMPQNYAELLPPEVSAVTFLSPSGQREEETMVRSYLGSLRFTREEMEHPLKDLSGGQRAKVLLLRLSLSDANVLLLDEPTRNFSPLSGPVIRQIFAAFPGCLISISHDRKYLQEVCETLYELRDGGLHKL